MLLKVSLPMAYVALRLRTNCDTNPRSFPTVVDLEFADLEELTASTENNYWQVDYQ